jgi:hypothetical protein
LLPGNNQERNIAGTVACQTSKKIKSIKNRNSKIKSKRKSEMKAASGYVFYDRLAFSFGVPRQTGKKCRCLATSVA